ncbi:hypothetical protein H696_00362 [Fonticula alba]|uniref:Glycosyltransferase subfamily 4-like N-terminal domain-containing protein n=1 Tax=Fonticula alba TaxID=691883 RepID=A0A058ZFT1_FONAL|nr:hypothetical protein H696_00362 [Fonticula alba]KCV72783.1 hypothetical protein H696_00362 [Fonticula alba]|eukprot:XP_009492484.1 hypothetical protein H696_00362 [Fonticula alba]
MRVLLYSTAIYPKVDGVANRVKHHIRALVALGHQVLVLCPYDSAPSLYEGAQVLRLPAFVPLDYDESQLSYPFPLMTLNRVFREFRPDIIHFIGPEFVLIPFLLLSRYYKVPILVSYHFYVRAFLNSMPFPMRMLFTWMTWMEMACNFADLVICPSKPMMNILRDIGMRCEDIWPPAVDIQQFSPSYYDHDLRSKVRASPRARRPRCCSSPVSGRD